MIGKTIKSVKKYKIEGYDDVPYLVLEFTDGTKKTLVSDYGRYTGNSLAEYPSFVDIKEGSIKEHAEDYGYRDEEIKEI